MGLDTVELIILIEKQLDISIADEDAAKIETVEELSNHCWKLVSDKGENGIYTKQSVKNVVKEIIHKISGIEIANISDDAKIVTDLGLD